MQIGRLEPVLAQLKIAINRSNSEFQVKKQIFDLPVKQVNIFYKWLQSMPYNEAVTIDLVTLRRGELALPWDLATAKNVIKYYEKEMDLYPSIELDGEISLVRVKNDAAMFSDSLQQKGGIDFNAANLDLKIKRDGSGVPLPFSQQDISSLNNLEGLEPVILDIRPATSLPFFSQLQSSPIPAST